MIIADNDTPRPVGFKAAHDLAVRAIKQGIKARIWQSDTLGYDALDELKEKGRLKPNQTTLPNKTETLHHENERNYRR